MNVYSPSMPWSLVCESFPILYDRHHVPGVGIYARRNTAVKCGHLLFCRIRRPMLPVPAPGRALLAHAKAAIRQSFKYCPPPHCICKCTFQLSRSSTFDNAAAIPPSAITVCALPSNDLHTKPTETPLAAASVAARRPAPPAPITSTAVTVCIV